MPSKCEVCGTELADDLFSFVTNERVCSICTVRFIGGITSPARIRQICTECMKRYDERGKTRHAETKA